MAAQDERRELEHLKSDIALRLRSVCGHFPETEFAELVDQIARIETKYALRAAVAPPEDSPAP